MVASKKTIGKLGMYIKNPNNLGYDINPAYVIETPSKNKLSKKQMKCKKRKTAHKSKMYNFIHS